MLWLAIVGVVFAVIGAFYYLRVIKVMYFDEPDGEALRGRATTGRCASCSASTRWRCWRWALLEPDHGLVPAGIRRPDQLHAAIR